MSQKPRTLDELKDATRIEIALINEYLLQRVHSNCLDLLASCYEQDKRHMLNVIFKNWNDTYLLIINIKSLK